MRLHTFTRGTGGRLLRMLSVLSILSVPARAVGATQRTMRRLAGGWLSAAGFLVGAAKTIR
jgi:hypothetical protein